MKRVIVDFAKLTPEILAMLVEKYPEGYAKKDIIKFTNAAGELVEAVEVRTEETLYLVKVSKRLAVVMDEYDEDDFDGVDPDDASAITDPLADDSDDDDDDNYDQPDDDADDDDDER
ncbi:MAG: hypothetical protein KDC83_13360 [Flavobacteriales bacterium]|nr:hypothetical protein [Flavobacteriales bacterium]